MTSDLPFGENAPQNIRSQIDIDGLAKWDSPTRAIRESFDAMHTVACPWIVVWLDDKRQACLAGMRLKLSQIPYDGRDMTVVGAPDPANCGGLEVLHA